MAFLFRNLIAEGYRVVGTNSGISKKTGKPWVSLTVVDEGGSTNEVSSTEPEIVGIMQTLRFGDVVDMRLTVAGGPKSQYAMISQVPNSLVVVQRAMMGTVDTGTGEVGF
jgi:hypothetical protein